MFGDLTEYYALTDENIGLCPAVDLDHQIGLAEDDRDYLGRECFNVLETIDRIARQRRGIDFCTEDLISEVCEFFNAAWMAGMPLKSDEVLKAVKFTPAHWAVSEIEKNKTRKGA